MPPGVTALVAAMRAFTKEWRQVDTIAVTFAMSDGTMLTLRLSGPVLELESSDGHLMTVELTNGPTV